MFKIRENVEFTCFICGDCQFIAGLALANAVFSIHADIVGGGSMEVNDSGLIQLGGNIFGSLNRIPGIYLKKVWERK